MNVCSVLLFHVPLTLLIQPAIGKVLLMDVLPHTLKLIVACEQQSIAILQFNYKGGMLLPFLRESLLLQNIFTELPTGIIQFVLQSSSMHTLQNNLLSGRKMHVLLHFIVNLRPILFHQLPDLHHVETWNLIGC